MPRDLYAPQSTDGLPLFARRAEDASAGAAVLASPRALIARDRALEALAKKSGEAFIQAASEFALDFLRTNGPATGEQIVDACKAAGIQPGDDKQFGPVIGGLSRRGQIAKHGYGQRSKGNGSVGIVWAAR